MSGITYTAIDRGQLITDSPAHVDGTDYSIDVKLQQHIDAIETPKVTHVSIAGNVETVLKRTGKIISAVFIWPDTENDDVEEWLYSVAAGESFIFDPYGTIASSDDPQSVVCVNAGYSIARMSHGSTPWRSVSLSLRFVV